MLGSLLNCREKAQLSLSLWTTASTLMWKTTAKAKHSSSTGEGHTQLAPRARTSVERARSYGSCSTAQ